jgi:uracil-DNA glycosylase family 4
MPDTIPILQQRIITCELCPRLREHCRGVAQIKRKAYLDWTYWGKPVPSFGDPAARLLIIGLAPGAHGANRTGRMFTGDSSGDFLYGVLHAAGFASQPESRSREDGLTLKGAYITAAAHCAPPDNKPLPQELQTCRAWLVEEIKLLPNIKVAVALGRIAFESYLTAIGHRRSAFQFGHNRECQLGPGMPMLIGSYHPSQQNTSTGRLTKPMLQAVFDKAAKVIRTGLK